MAHDALSLPSGAGGSDSCTNCAIRHSSLCGALSTSEINDLNSIARRRTIAPGQPYVMEGETSRDFANVTSGVAKLIRGAEDGRSQIVGLLFPSDFIVGSLGKNASLEAPQSVEAVTELKLCVFPRLQFEELLHDYPSLEFKLLNRTLDELQIAREWMVLLGRKTAEERVASFFLYLTRKMNNLRCNGQTSFDLPIGRAEIADYIGLTLETVSRQISKLKKDGVISFDGTKHVSYINEVELAGRAGF
ncbi:MAG: Crp/Fnr family transcriptional regulator [Pseudomonadota bacterium]